MLLDAEHNPTSGGSFPALRPYKNGSRGPVGAKILTRPKTAAPLSLARLIDFLVRLESRGGGAALVQRIAARHLR